MRVPPQFPQSSQNREPPSPDPVSQRRPWRRPHVILSSLSSDVAKTLIHDSPPDVHVTQPGLNSDNAAPLS